MLIILFNLLLATETILLCFFFFFLIVSKSFSAMLLLIENSKLWLPPLIPTSVPITVSHEATKTKLHVAD